MIFIFYLRLIIVTLDCRRPFHCQCAHSASAYPSCYPYVKYLPPSLLARADLKLARQIFDCMVLNSKLGLAVSHGISSPVCLLLLHKAIADLFRHFHLPLMHQVIIDFDPLPHNYSKLNFSRRSYCYRICSIYCCSAYHFLSDN